MDLDFFPLIYLNVCNEYPSLTGTFYLNGCCSQAFFADRFDNWFPEFAMRFPFLWFLLIFQNCANLLITMDRREKRTFDTKALLEDVASTRWLFYCPGDKTVSMISSESSGWPKDFFASEVEPTEALQIANPEPGYPEIP